MPENLKVAFVGDISFNDRFVDQYRSGEDPFSQISSILQDQDHVIGNLECLTKGKTGENALRSTRLSTHVDTLNYLKNFHVSVVSLAHNHIYDHLVDGYSKTIEFLSQHGIRYLGAGYAEEEAGQPMVLTKNGVNIGLLNYVTRDTNPNLPDDAPVSVNFFDPDRVENDIKKLKKSVNHVVLLLHWGGKTENGYYPDLNQPKIAKNLIDAGADMIIGHHSHTLQPFEIYKGKYIFYSLGNFCFSDVITDHRTIEMQIGKNTETLIVQVNFTADDYKVEFIPIDNRNNDLHVNPAILNKLKKRNSWYKLISKSSLLWQCYYLKLKNIDPMLFYFFGNNRNPLKQLRNLKLGKIKKYIRKISPVK